jgi:GPH family glycoside/pentoside/hexuronide:cation symporter
MTKYGLGACTESLVLNSIFAFSMLYYTKALGLPPELAGLVTFAATMWDAITDPIMGHISDHTKSRFGKRYPYMAAGGIIMIVSFFFIWYIPDIFKRETVIGATAIPARTMLFGYLFMMNLVLRTGYTIFIVPYTALGFEICTDYEGRSKVQGIRSALNMAANLLGPALAWTIFFKNNAGQVQDTQIARNYFNMGSAFTAASFICLALLLAFTAKYIKDSRVQIGHCNTVGFFENFKAILMDRYCHPVFAFTFVVLLGIVLVSTLQIYVFDDFMRMNGFQKTIAHGSTMAAMGLGSLSLGSFVRRFEKKGAIFAAVMLSAFSELILAVLFLTGFLHVEQKGMNVPIGFSVFTFLHSIYWFGNGILVPTSMSMIADISEINTIQTGFNKDASYASMFTLSIKMAMGVAGLMAGYCLGWTGFQVGYGAAQTLESIWRVGALTFVVGPLVSLAALLLLVKYPVNKAFIESCRNKSLPQVQ